MRLQNGIVHHERLERQKRTEIFAATLYERPKRLCSAIRFWCEHTVRATVSYCFLALFHTMCTWFYRGLRPLIYSLIFSVWCFFPEASVNVNVSIVWYGTKCFFSEYFNNIAGFYYIFSLKGEHAVSLIHELLNNFSVLLLSLLLVYYHLHFLYIFI